MEAFPGLDLQEYKIKLIEMSTKTADTRETEKDDDENADIYESTSLTIQLLRSDVR